MTACVENSFVVQHNISIPRSECCDESRNPGKETFKSNAPDIEVLIGHDLEMRSDAAVKLFTPGPGSHLSKQKP